MRRTLFTLILGLALTAGCAALPDGEMGAAIEKTMSGAHRSEANRARDVYRHPRETLQFFGLKPDMKVVEIWPGVGWYSEILAPVLRERGEYYAAQFYLDETATPNMVAGSRSYEKMLAGRPAFYDRVRLTSFMPPRYLEIAPPGSADLVLTFRNVHNWAAAGSDEAAFRAFYDALKPGGTLGVVEHRAAPGTSREQMIRIGYLTETYVIALAEKAGFRLAGRSEINANPRDTKNYPEGVWTLPPTYRLGDQDRAKYAAIGESDRMTLKFLKP